MLHLLVLQLCLQLILRHGLRLKLLLTVLALITYELGLLGLLPLVEQDGAADLVFLFITVFTHLSDALSRLLLLDLLSSGLLRALEVLDLVLLFQLLHFLSSPPGFFDFLPRFHLFLLEESYSVGKQLRVSFRATQNS